MSQAPAMPIWTDALIGDTTHLSTEEFGAYMLVLIATWRNNGIPFADDDTRLARICRATTARWSKLRPVLVVFFDLSGGTWRQKRLEKEWNLVAEKIAKNREKGKLSGEARRLKSKEPNGTAVPPRFEPEGEPNANNLYPDQVSKSSVGSNEPTGAAAPPLTVVAGTEHKPPPDPQKALFEFGKRVLGPKAGGVIVKLLRRHDGDVPATMHTLRLAEGKQSPAEYVGAILRGEREPEPDWDAEYLRMGVRPDGTSLGDDSWVPPMQRPGDDGDGVRSIA